MGALEATVRIIEAVLNPLGIAVGVAGGAWLLRRLGLWTAPLPGQVVKKDKSTVGPAGVTREIEYVQYPELDHLDEVRTDPPLGNG